MKLWLTTFCAVALLAASAVIYRHDRNTVAALRDKHTDIRTFMIKSQMRQAVRPIVIVGDSITEAALLPSSICGHPLINAGISGLDAGGYLGISGQLFTADDALIVIALGTNNPGTFEASYNRLADLLAQHAPKLIFAGIPPLEFSGELAKQSMSDSIAEANNVIIHQVAANRGSAFVDLRAAMKGGDALTLDGVHFNAAGYKLWNPAILNAVSASLPSCAAGSAQ